MHLTKYRVKNFRSVEDSGWIEVSNVTAFVGVNESGKTNLLLPLWKFNPAKEGALEGTADYPKNNFGAIRANPAHYEFVEVYFELDDGEANDVAEITGHSPEQVRSVKLTRKFDGNFTWFFPRATPPKDVSAERIFETLDNLEKSASASKELASESGLIGRIREFVTSTTKELRDRISQTAFDSVFTTLSSMYVSDHAKTSALYPRILQAIDELKPVHSTFHRASPTATEGLWDYFKPRMPVFLYYSNYGNLDSEIYLPHVVENLKREDLGEKEAAKARTLRVLFNFVGLDPEEILELGRDFKDISNPAREPSTEEIEAVNKKKKERAILLQSAGTKLTGKFRDWWKQGDYRFRFDADGDHFRIWVSDDRRPDEVELEGRSTGLQWFLSFYLVFLVESEGDHKNAVLLLDEPGLSLHPLAQRNLSAFFESLSATNQILFTTHSPFLVDADNLDKARKVYVADDGSTKATSNLREGESRKSQPGATYALNSALNLSVAESILVGCEPIVVEGPSDQYILSGIKNLLIGAGIIKPKREFVFPPSGGAKSIRVIAGILLGRDDVLPTVLMDDDTIGRSAAKELKSDLYKGNESKVLNIADVVEVVGAEIEDIVPSGILIDVIDRTYRPDEPFSDVYQTGQPIVPQIEKWAKAHEIELDKGWKVPIAAAVKKRLLASDFSALDKNIVDQWIKLFGLFGNS